MILLAALGLRFQMSRVEIDVAEPLPLGGYTARGSKLSQPGGEPLFARTLVLREGSLKVAIVSCDLLTIPQSLSREVVKRIPRGVDLFLCATHTHSAPDSQMLNDRMTFSIPGIASFRPRILDLFASRIAAGVRAALGGPMREIGNLELVQAEASLNRGRRPGARPGGAATLLRVGPSGPNLLFDYAAHAVFFGPERLQTSADWPGRIANRFGCPVLADAIGDVSPAAPGATPEARIDAFDRAMGAAISAGSVRNEAAQLAFLRESFELGPPSAHPSMGKAYHVPQSVVEGLVKSFAPREAQITGIRVGRVAILGIPGEPTSILGEKIRAIGARLGFDATLVVSHTNGWCGYLLDPEDYDRGGYEATLSFYGREQGDRVVRSAVRALIGLASGLGTRSKGIQ